MAGNNDQNYFPGNHTLAHTNGGASHSLYGNLSAPGYYSNMSVNATDDCTSFPFALNSIAMGILCISGFTGNTISFLVLNQDRSTPVASFLLQSLAIADNIFLLLWLITYSVSYILKHFHLQVSTGWLYTRVITHPMLYIAQMETIWMTVVIALNRFMAVCLPYRAPHLCNISNVYKEVAIVSLFSIVYNLPRFFELVITEVPDVAVNRTDLGNSDMYHLVYIDVLYYLFSFILPLVILAFVNTRVIIAYNASRQRRRRMTSRRTESENNITLVMIMVVLIFMLCQAPARIVQMIWAYEFDLCSEPVFYLIHISNTLEVLNSSVNFIIYCVFHQRFRVILRTHFCFGPFARAGRRDSARFTTTEGLSLEEVQKSTPTSSKKTSTSKSSSVHHQEQATAAARNGVVTHVNEQKVQVEADENVKTPLNGGQSQEEEAILDNPTEPKEDCTVPLHP